MAAILMRFIEVQFVEPHFYNQNHGGKNRRTGRRKWSDETHIAQ